MLRVQLPVPNYERKFVIYQTIYMVTYTFWDEGFS